MPSTFMLRVALLNVVMNSVVGLNVVAPSLYAGSAFLSWQRREGEKGGERDREKSGR